MLKDIELKGLKTLIATEIAVEAIDDIKGTTLYKGKAKQHGNTFVNVMAPVLKNQLVNIYNVDPELTTNLFRELDQLIVILSKLNIVDMVMIKQIYDHYSKNPEDWQNLYNLEFTKLKQ